MASNTKTYVSAAVLRLYEDGKLKLDAPVAGLLSKESVETLRRGGYQPDAITVRHLLTHTSGIFDYAMTPAYQEAVLGARTNGGPATSRSGSRSTRASRTACPGTVFKYSDTGYILLGEIIERVSGQPLAAALRALLSYERNGWKATWLETLEPVPAGVRRSRPTSTSAIVDTYAFDPSFDLCGGAGWRQIRGTWPRSPARCSRERCTGRRNARRDAVAAAGSRRSGTIDTGSTPR